jgi:hypothetical protein
VSDHNQQSPQRHDLPRRPPARSYSPSAHPGIPPDPFSRVTPRHTVGLPTHVYALWFCLQGRHRQDGPASGYPVRPETPSPPILAPEAGPPPQQGTKAVAYPLGHLGCCLGDEHYAVVLLLGCLLRPRGKRAGIMRVNPSFPIDPDGDPFASDLRRAARGLAPMVFALSPTAWAHLLGPRCPCRSAQGPHST